MAGLVVEDWDENEACERWREVIKPEVCTKDGAGILNRQISDEKCPWMNSILFGCDIFPNNSKSEILRSLPGYEECSKPLDITDYGLVSNSLPTTLSSTGSVFKPTSLSRVNLSPITIATVDVTPSVTAPVATTPVAVASTATTPVIPARRPAESDPELQRNTPSRTDRPITLVERMLRVELNNNDWSLGDKTDKIIHYIEETKCLPMDSRERVVRERA